MIVPGFALLLVLATMDPASAPPDAPVEFRLQDHRGAWHDLGEAKDARVVVLAFVGTECPLAEAYAPRLAGLAREYQARGAAFFAVDANEQDGPVAIGRYAARHGLTFPILKDVGNALADRLEAERTPEVFVLDRDRTIRYRGRIDDQLALGVHRPAATTHELKDALDAILAGRTVATPRAAAVGCRIGRLARPAGRADAAVTYSKQVARILGQHCVACHRPGEIAPFALTDYQQAAGWSSMIAEVVDDGRMPPWHADPGHGRFANDARLAAGEKQVIRDWVAAGAPEGDPADLPPRPRFADGWRIPQPDVVLEMPREVEIPAKGDMPYQLVVIDPRFTRDVWVRASQVRPGNAAVVHHMIAYVLPPGATRIDEAAGNFLAAYAPGMPPQVHPEGVARRVPAGSKLVFQLHYTPRGIEQVDRTRIGLVFADPAAVRKELMGGMALNHEFRIPAGAADFVTRADYRFDQSALLYSLMPHMHLRGRSMRFEAEYPDGRREVLLDVPRYEFDWQNLYVLAGPKLMPEGTVLHTTAHFDNSPDNPNNPDPTRPVTFGEQTRNEMHVGYLNFALLAQDLALGGPKVQAAPDGRSEVTFRYKPDAPTPTVSLVGTFTDWKDHGIPMTGPDPEGFYTARVPLGPGAHEYKFLLGGERYRSDPGNPLQAGFFHNSLIRLDTPPGAP